MSRERLNTNHIGVEVCMGMGFPMGMVFHGIPTGMGIGFE